MMMRPTSSVSFCEGQFNLTSRVICKPIYISNNKHVTPIPEPIETEPQTEYKTVTVKWNANDFDGNSYEGTIPGGFVECAGYSISKAK